MNKVAKIRKILYLFSVAFVLLSVLSFFTISDLDFNKIRIAYLSTDDDFTVSEIVFSCDNNSESDEISTYNDEADSENDSSDDSFFVVLVGDDEDSDTNDENDSSFLIDYSDSEETETNVDDSFSVVEVESSSCIDISLAETVCFLEGETGSYINGVFTCCWTGVEIEPTIYIEYNGEELNQTTEFVIDFRKNTETASGDFTVEYSENRDIGFASATITGTGDYTGTITLEFEIVECDISSSWIEMSEIENEILYTGSEITPEITITNTALNTSLEENVDYTIDYSNNKSLGVATITITGTGKYTGSVIINFNIITDSAPETESILDNFSNDAVTTNSETANNDSSVLSIIEENKEGIIYIASGVGAVVGIAVFINICLKFILKKR